MQKVLKLLLPIALAACASSETTGDTAQVATSPATTDYSVWIGRNISEMLAEYGEPSWSREYKSDEVPGAARWYHRRRTAGTTGRHISSCFIDVLYDENGTIRRAASSNNTYCGPPVTKKTYDAQGEDD